MLALCLSPRPCDAGKFEGTVDAYGQIQIWATIYEQMEVTDELYQFPSGDPAVQVASGFSLARVRAGVKVHLLGQLLEMVIAMRLERGPAILDAHGTVNIHDAFRIVVGQFKIPSAWENQVATTDLDFITRATISENLADFALSRTTYASSLFFGIHSYLRDLGIAVKGDVDVGPGRLRYLLMLGNGLGANRFIGGGTSKEYIISNAGQFFLGARLEAARFFDVVTMGCHVSWNRHDNMVFNSGRTVMDLDRLSWSVDTRLTIPRTGLRLSGMYGAGIIEDDYDDDGRTDAAYSGWEVRMVFRLNDAVSTAIGRPFLPGHILEAGARFDSYVYEWNETGAPVTRNTWTFGVRYICHGHVDLKLDYMLIRTDDPTLRDLDDDALILQIQFAI